MRITAHTLIDNAVFMDVCSCALIYLLVSESIYMYVLLYACRLVSCCPVCRAVSRKDFEGNNGKEKAMDGHPFTMVPEVGGSSSPNITTQADIVLTGCPCLPADGSSWIGQSFSSFSH